MDYLFPPEPAASVGIVGRSEQFPVRRIYCVGHNYLSHIHETGRDPDRESPFFFNKPSDGIVSDGGSLPYPPATASLHHEVELVVAIEKGGYEISTEAADEHIFGYAVGIDLTRKDLQQVAEDRSLPWTAAKAFDRSAPCGLITPKAECPPMNAGRIALSVNDRPRQDADLKEMIWSVPEIVSYLSRMFELKPGDLVFTGTPAGVGFVLPGDRVTASIEGLAPLHIKIEDAD
ncbi:fumarylacetoacetate hydrolase family protein [Denitrobaculum tricleocarpae]|uniref:Fumarylacetoacetate hydrolase family protein n=1 Tax=Denitrobaculum tricleocarpae TaxID=2591009 RepID=A0A545TP98_9PROT|nr:fumarylacetoacetate hydrolase family protein [Denitrobaculum tricleocarpae]TQV79050.1 fumarylacetoacetate hydrolase family protein [Denitrobaculum tricleocarpae]